MSNTNQAAAIDRLTTEFKNKLIEIVCQFDARLDTNCDNYTGVITKSKVVLINNDNSISEFVYKPSSNRWHLHIVRASISLPVDIGVIITEYRENLVSNENVILK